MSSVIYIDSDSDSDKTIEFEFQAHHLCSESETRKSLPQCKFNANELIMKEQEFLENYNRLKSATREIRKLLNEHPNFLSYTKINDEVERIRKLDLHWDREITLFKNQRRAMIDNSSNETADELLANIKRMRWCFTCLKEAQIREEVPAPRFFCSIECQLKFYDS